MLYIRDTDDLFATNAYLAIRKNTSKEFLLDLEGRSGYYLQCSSVADLSVEFKLDGAVSWTDLEATPVDTTPYVGIRQPIVIRVTRGNTSDGVREVEIFCWPV